MGEWFSQMLICILYYNVLVKNILDVQGKVCVHFSQQNLWRNVFKKKTKKKKKNQTNKQTHTYLFKIIQNLND